MRDIVNITKCFINKPADGAVPEKNTEAFLKWLFKNRRNHLGVESQVFGSNLHQRLHQRGIRRLQRAAVREYEQWTSEVCKNHRSKVLQKFVES